MRTLEAWIDTRLLKFSIAYHSTIHSHLHTTMQTKGVKSASYQHRTLAVTHALQALLPPTKRRAMYALCRLATTISYRLGCFILLKANLQGSQSRVLSSPGSSCRHPPNGAEWVPVKLNAKRSSPNRRTQSCSCPPLALLARHRLTHAHDAASEHQSPFAYSGLDGLGVYSGVLWGSVRPLTKNGGL